MTAFDRDLPIVAAHHLTAALACSPGSLNKLLMQGKVPPPDVRGRSNAKLWKLSTIRAWRPAVADTVSKLIPLLPIQPLLNAA